MLFLGCDAGSTKTEFLLASDSKGLLCRKTFPACNYLEVGYEAFSSTMHKWISQVLQLAKATAADFYVYGIPTLGEVEELEKYASQALGEYGLHEHSLLVNDAMLGWAGSLGGQNGINVVSGTGSIVYGEDGCGGQKRVGGWSLLFDDIGSCAWVGRQTLQLFFHQMDGRAPRGALYDILCEHWNLGKHPEYFGGKVLRTLNTDRSALAAVQLQARRAADAGDKGVKHIYRQAILGLAQQAQVVKNALCFPANEPVLVSYSGGFFRNGPFVLKPFEEAVTHLGMILQPPQFSPAVGALALGAKRFLDPTELNDFLRKIQEVITRKAEQTFIYTPE